ncbi:hypothetical protein COCMIDRAFT_109991, partial [Bipolaris oryzae ATCC 44560]
VTYENPLKSRHDICFNYKNFRGCYLWTSKTTGKQYIGSSINLSLRLTEYFRESYLTLQSGRGSIICRAILKYGQDDFYLSILSLGSLGDKDNYYKPKYNILKIAGSSQGFTHKIETIVKLKELFRKENHPKYGYISSSDTKKAISEGIKQFYINNSHTKKGLKGKLSAQYGIGGKFVYCYDKKNNELIFPSINAARQHFKTR